MQTRMMNQKKKRKMIHDGDARNINLATAFFFARSWNSFTIFLVRCMHIGVKKRKLIKTEWISSTYFTSCKQFQLYNIYQTFIIGFFSSFFFISCLRFIYFWWIDIFFQFVLANTSIIIIIIKRNYNYSVGKRHQLNVHVILLWWRESIVIVENQIFTLLQNRLI